MFTVHPRASTRTRTLQDTTTVRKWKQVGRGGWRGGGGGHSPASAPYSGVSRIRRTKRRSRLSFSTNRSRSSRETEPSRTMLSPESTRGNWGMELGRSEEAQRKQRLSRSQLTRGKTPAQRGGEKTPQRGGGSERGGSLHAPAVLVCVSLRGQQGKGLAPGCVKRQEREICVHAVPCAQPVDAGALNTGQVPGIQEGGSTHMHGWPNSKNTQE